MIESRVPAKRRRSQRKSHSFGCFFRLRGTWKFSKRPFGAMKRSQTKPKRIISSLLLLLSIVFVVLPASAQTITPWWGPVAETHKQLFQYLKEKDGEIALPNYPANNVLNWSLGRFPSSDAKSPNHLEGENYRKAVLRVVHEHLLVSDDILKKLKQLKNSAAVAQEQRRVLQLSEAAALQADVNLGDYWLVARIREIYQLPLLDAATEDGASVVGQQNIIESVSADYERAKEPEKEIAALKALTVVATTRNMADSARAKLARAYAEKKDYERAIAYLEAIRDPSMIGPKSLIPNYQQLLSQQLQVQQQTAKN